MTATGWIQLGLYVAVLWLLTKPLVAYMARDYQFKSLFGLDKALGPIERGAYKA